MIDLSIIIVNFNVKDFLEQTLLSVNKAVKNISHEIYVVDNASVDGSVEFIRKKFPDVKLIVNKENAGFAKANNQALALAKGEFILMLNPDTVVQEDTFSVIIDFFRTHPDCGMAGCKILNPDGSLQLACRRSFPTPWVAFTRIIGLSYLFPRSRWFGKYNLTYMDPDEIYEVEAISGSCMFVRKKVIEQIGYFDDAFFMYGEDLDLCYRIHEANWKIYYLPTTKIIHFKGESSKKSNIDLTIHFYNAMKLFVEKHYHSKYFSLPQWFLVLGIFLRAGFSLFSKLVRACIPLLLDLVFLNISLILAILIRFGSLGHFHSYIIVTIIYSSIWLSCLFLLGVYTDKKYYSLRAALGVIIGLILNTSITFFFNQYAFSRIVVIISSVFNILFISGWRFLVKLLPRLGIISAKNLSDTTVWGKKTLIVGTGESTSSIIEKLRVRIEGGYQIVGLITLNDKNEQFSYSGVNVLGTIDDLDRIIRNEKIQEVIFSTKDITYDDILNLMIKTRRKGVNFKLIPGSMEVIIGKASIDRINSVPLIDIEYKIDSPTSVFVKRSIDIILSMIVLFFTTPISLWILILRKAKLVRKKYLSYNNACIEIFEFQSIKSNLKPWVINLPRFWAVLKGDLSIVGSELKRYNEHELNNSNIALKPGLFGLVQLNKNSGLTTEEKQQYELFYLKNFTPLLDFEIVLKSIFKI